MVYWTLKGVSPVMRCACPNCGEFMEHAETSASCVCPVCLARCTACLGTDSVISRETFLRMKPSRPDDLPTPESPDQAGYDNNQLRE